MKRLTTQQGFTLIELMIVIAIIGILAAIALPAYQDYTARAQASEVLIAADGIKTDIAIYYWENKTMPPASNPVTQQAREMQGKYFDRGSMTIASGIITTRITRGANVGKTITIIPHVNSSGNGQVITWECSGSIEAKRLPSTCQL